MAAEFTGEVSAARLFDRKAPEEIGGTHYQQGVKTSPWDLQQQMESSGIAFVDARRADAIKYTFRKKGDNAKLLEDLKKAQHCLKAGIERLERELDTPQADRG